MPLAPGSRLGAYEMWDVLGKGGLGEVYRARHPRLRRDIALKFSGASFPWLMALILKDQPKSLVELRPEVPERDRLS